MADNNFRAYRSRDAVARDEIDANAPDSVRDPLAELARLIGQADPASDFSRNARREPVQQYDDTAPAAPAQEWAAEEGDDEQNRYAEDSYTPPPLADAYPPPRDYPRYRDDDTREPPLDDRYPERADDFAAPRAREPVYDESYRDEDTPALPRGRRLPALAPQSDDDEYQDDEQWQDDAEERPYASDEYDDEAESRSGRSGMVLIMAVLGLTIIGVASAFAYRTMFGGTLLPSLPPIIKAGDGPNKIVPAQAAALGSANAANPNAGEKLVPREEQPVPIQPQNLPPRVVATIPVVPAQGAAPPSAQSPNPAVPAPAAQSVFPPPPALAAAPAAPAAPASGSAEPKKVHTVLIRPDQSGGGNTPAAAAPAPAARPAAPAPAATRPVPAAAPRPAANAPLALVPTAQGSAVPVEPPRTQVARAEPASTPLATAPAAAASAGGYAVQVTSQRSEAEAEAAFKALQAKFPTQLGSHQPIIHRADLGDKGTFYRALVGPFASAEAAAGMCSNLKAAGGSCIVQKN
jgi:hypothetical protein